jgi:hypothetical protein
VEGWAKRLPHLGLVILVSALVITPFLILCPTEFLNFPSYYLLGRSGQGSAGMSVINLLGVGGWHIPGTVGVGLTLVAFILALYLFRHWKLDVWRGAMLVTVAFLSVYPMIRLGYFIYPFVFFSVWAVRDRGIALRLVPLYLTLLFGQAFEKASPGFDVPFSWLISLLLVVTGLVVMWDLTRLCLKRSSFIDGDEREGNPSA